MYEPTSTIREPGAGRKAQMLILLLMRNTRSSDCSRAVRLTAPTFGPIMDESCVKLFSISFHKFEQIQKRQMFPPFVVILHFNRNKRKPMNLWWELQVLPKVGSCAFQSKLFPQSTMFVSKIISAINDCSTGIHLHLSDQCGVQHTSLWSNWITKWTVQHEMHFTECQGAEKYFSITRNTWRLQLLCNTQDVISSVLNIHQTPHFESRLRTNIRVVGWGHQVGFHPAAFCIPTQSSTTKLPALLNPYSQNIYIDESLCSCLQLYWPRSGV